MGLSESKPERLTAEKREQRETAKATMVEQRKQEINHVQQSILSSANSSSSQALIEQKDIVAMIKVSETAKKQLDRGGNALTKSDLIAVLVALQPSMKRDIAKLESVTISDLNSMIRSIIYDPSRVLGTAAVSAATGVQYEPGQKDNKPLALTYF